MAGQRADVSFELFVLGRRGWELLARYPERDRASALSYAKSLEEDGKAAKIIREDFHASTNQTEEVTVYLSRNLVEAQAALSRPPPSSGGGRRSSGDGASAAGESSSSGKGKAFSPIVRGPKSGVDLVFRAVAIGVSSIVVAGFATIIASLVLSQMASVGQGVSRESFSSTLFLVFLGAFTLTSIPLLLAFIGLSDADPVRGARRNEPSWWERFSSNNEKKKVGTVSEPIAPVFSQPEPVEQIIEESEIIEEPQRIEEPEPEYPIPVPDIPVLEAGDEVKVEDAPGMEKSRKAIMRFLGGAVDVLKGTNAQLDPFSKFGLHLMVAGAADALGRDRFLDGTQRQKLTQEALEVLGVARNLAQSFCNKLDEYLQTPRYLAMFESGAASMRQSTEGAAAPYDNLAYAMKEWNSPTAPTAKQAMITVMFTDMVGSTNITQTRGDDSAQILVRTHNTIVRAVLKDFSGREIKHTGDGIMASFNSSLNAVEATIAIQQAVATQPHEMNLHLRIGLNAGEPIQEENDLFGTTVQLAARICAKAAEDQILVSDVVRLMASGKQLRFIPKGLFEMKGVTEPQPLYEVLWKASDIAAAAAVAPTVPTASPSQAPVGTTPRVSLAVKMATANSGVSTSIPRKS